MNLNINRIKIIISTIAAFFICCSMKANCNTPGPATEVHGMVTDGVTGKPIANLPMEVSSGGYDPHYFSTNTDGSYDLKFTPEKLLNYGLGIARSAANNYLFSFYMGVKQGTDTAINYKAYPAINVTVHLINHSDYGQNTFQLMVLDTLTVNTPSYLGGMYLSDRSLLIDTIAKYPMAHYTHVSFESDFSTNGGYPAVKAIKQSYILGNKDTLINITNP